MVNFSRRYSYPDIRKDARRHAVFFFFIFLVIAVFCMFGIHVIHNKVAISLNCVNLLFDIYMMTGVIKQYRVNKEY
jgi:hypothetical protein